MIPSELETESNPPVQGNKEMWHMTKVVAFMAMKEFAIKLAAGIEIYCLLGVIRESNCNSMLVWNLGTDCF